jgi:hypothetical protein
MAHANKAKEMEFSESEMVSEGTSSGSEGHSVAKTVTKTASAVSEATSEKKSFRMGDVWCNVHAFERIGKNGPFTTHSTSFSKSYKDKDGKWRHTQFYDKEDLGALMELAKNAVTYLDSLDAPDQVA